jgi:flagellar hook-length control protein FliK
VKNVNAQNLLQNPALDLLAKLPPGRMEKSNNRNINEGYGNNFRQIMDKEISKTQAAAVTNFPSNRESFQKESSTDETVQVLSFREIADDLKKTGTKEDTKFDGLIKKNSAVDNSKDKVDTALDSLAGFLGMAKSELAALLNFLGLRPEELLEPAGLNRITEKLSSFAGLNGQQEETLKAMLKEINAQLKPGKENSGRVYPDINAKKDFNTEGISQEQKTEASKQPLFIKHLEIVTVSSDGSGTSFEEIASRLKLRMEQLTSQYIKDPQAFCEQLAEETGKLFKEADGQRNNDQKVYSKMEAESAAMTAEKADGQKNGDQKVYSQAKTESAVTTADKSDGNAVKSVITSEKENVTADKSADVKETSRNEMSDSMEGDNSRDEGFLADKPLKTDEVQIPDSDIPDGSILSNPEARFKTIFTEVYHAGEVPVQKQDVLAQVIEKAKVILDGDKSEMVMDLIPDSLGKLSMKVTTEHGIVMAKFVAENQQVKQIIESNLNLLKDSLEKQGMDIQDFSVSVRDQSSGGFYERNQFERKTGKRRNAGMLNSAAVMSVNAAEINDRLAAYYPSGSTINLTA